MKVFDFSSDTFCSFLFCFWFLW